MAICHSKQMMKADRVEVSHDEYANRWLIRVQIGDEVIIRTCHESKGADEEKIREAAVKAAEDEGYEVDPLNILFS